VTGVEIAGGGIAVLEPLYPVSAYSSKVTAEAAPT
jgi:hypothetical protein